jgi:hypothetical protein
LPQPQVQQAIQSAPLPTVSQPANITAAPPQLNGPQLPQQQSQGQQATISTQLPASSNASSSTATAQQSHQPNQLQQQAQSGVADDQSAYSVEGFNGRLDALREVKETTDADLQAALDELDQCKGSGDKAAIDHARGKVKALAHVLEVFIGYEALCEERLESLQGGI